MLAPTGELSTYHPVASHGEDSTTSGPLAADRAREDDNACRVTSNDTGERNRSPARAGAEYRGECSELRDTL